MSPRQPSLSLFTDLYELTMAQAFWKSGMTGQAVFSLFFRTYPAERGYFVFAGLADVLDFLENFRFAPADLDYLRSLQRFEADFLAYLESVRFTGNVRALVEGTVFFLNEPVLEITAPVLEAQLLETYVVNQVNLQSILAGKAARARYAAGDREVVDFAARRAQGIDAANKLARVCYLVGFDGTSNALAAALYGLPVFGTMAHSYVTCFTSETESFRKFAEAFPDTSTFLVDTYDTLAGTRKAVEVAGEMQKKGHRLQGIRLDSGDLLDLSRRCRILLDQAGFPEVKILASGGLDEFEVQALRDAGAAIDVFCVGTKVGVSADAPLTDCAYKLVAYAGRPVLKLSPKKQTLPGPKQVFRYRSPDGRFLHDVLARAEEAPGPGGEPLLAEVMHAGRRRGSLPTLEELRRRFHAQFAFLPEPHKRLRSPELYEVRLSPELEALTREVAQQIKSGE